MRTRSGQIGGRCKNAIHGGGRGVCLHCSGEKGVHRHIRGVALDNGPFGQLLEPMGTLPFETAVDMLAEIVDAGVNAGADLICIETITNLYEGESRPACRKGAFDAARVGDDELRRDRAHLHRLHNSVHGADAGRLGRGRDWAELLAGAEAAAAALSGALPCDDPARDCQTERGSARPG